MSHPSTRRTFLQTAAVGGVAAASTGFNFLRWLPPVSASEVKKVPNLVQFAEHIEPLVRLIEDAPRQELLGRVADRIHRGTSYRDVLAALLLAGVRNVQPRPQVGFKFHAVLVVNSCHLASLYGPDEDRWLPIFWALDNFKSSQADEARNSGWHMQPVNEAKVPAAEHARQAFTAAMDRWDAEAADAATAGLVRTAGATEVFNLFAKYAARDYRSIGHKVIFLANAWRTLEVIGWEFAEPVLRSLAFALQNHTGEPNPAESDLDVDRPWRKNAELVEGIPANWLSGKLLPEAPQELFAQFREGTPVAAAETAAELLGKGAAAQSIWDGVFVGAGELLMRQPGIIGLHGLTTANAMHYVWRHAADDRLRRQLLLQACSFNPMFRESAKGRDRLRSNTVDELEPANLDAAGDEALEEIFTDVSGNAMQAATKVEAYLKAGGDPQPLIDQARRLIFLKGRDAHDYMFSSAVLEDFDHVSPAWRDRFLALSVFNLKGSGDRDNGLVERTREALAG